MAIVIILGFSEDYIVHMAIHYSPSSYKDRHSRTKEVIKKLGVSILSCGVTSILSGIFLFAAKTLLFRKFAVIITSTMVFSLLYTLIFFISLSHMIGPENQVGRVDFMIKQVLNRCRTKV